MEDIHQLDRNPVREKHSKTYTCNNGDNDNDNNSSSHTPMETSSAVPAMRPSSLPVRAVHSSPVVDVLGDVPALSEQMESLQALQSRQKELDEWYETMQKQLDLEKMR